MHGKGMLYFCNIGWTDLPYLVPLDGKIGCVPFFSLFLSFARACLFALGIGFDAAGQHLNSCGCAMWSSNTQWTISTGIKNFVSDHEFEP
jgi:hypothetical protein